MRAQNQDYYHMLNSPAKNLDLREDYDTPYGILLNQKRQVPGAPGG